MTQPAPDPRPLDLPADFVPGNVYDKYGTRNPLYRSLMTRFLRRCAELLGSLEVGELLEVGSGPGDLWRELQPQVGWGAGVRYFGSDLSLAQGVAARAQSPGLRYLGTSIYRLPFGDSSFDCVLAAEVLEHVERPELALDELARISRRYVLLSVPWEPIWRGLNMARGAYLRHLGNTPGHLQHFSRRRIRRLVAARFDILAEARPFPWTVLLAECRSR